MTDIEKREIVKSIIEKSGIDYDIDLYKDESNKEVKHYENIMGSDSFFVLSSKAAFSDLKSPRKELYVIVDEKYAFVQLTTVYEENGLITKRVDDIVRYKKYSDEIIAEKACLVQNMGVVELHSIEEMKKIDKNFTDDMINRKVIKVDSNFKFTLGFDKVNFSLSESEHLDKNIVKIYVDFSMSTLNAA